MRRTTDPPPASGPCASLHIDPDDVAECLVPIELTRPRDRGLPERETEGRERVVRDAVMTLAGIGARVPDRNDGSAAEGGCSVRGVGDRHPTVPEDGPRARDSRPDPTDDDIEPPRP